MIENLLICLKNNGFENVVYIPNPISESLKQMAESVNFDTKIIDVGSFVFVGQIIPTKGVYELIEACCSVKGIKQLILIGPVNKAFKNELASLASKSNHGDWLSWKGEISRKDVFKYLYSANALCLPSYTEGFPNVILEAMAIGCPVIATKVGAIEEMLDCGKYGKAGICIDPYNTIQISQALEYCIFNTEEIKRLAVLGNKKVRTHYTLDKAFKEYEKIW